MKKFASFAIIFSIFFIPVAPAQAEHLRDKCLFMDVSSQIYIYIQDNISHNFYCLSDSKVVGDISLVTVVSVGENTDIVLEIWISEIVKDGDDEVLVYWKRKSSEIPYLNQSGMSDEAIILFLFKNIIHDILKKLVLYQ